MRILVTGSSGQLGQCLQRISKEKKDNSWLFINRNMLDINNIDHMMACFEKAKPDYCINTAAYTAVDLAEKESDKAYKINQEAVGCLAKVCHEHQTTLVHVSTDFVFDGKKNTPYKETDFADPINVYGLSKRAGEQEVLEKCASHFIIRTSWLYSAYGKNFVKTMLDLAKQRDEIQVVSDQIGTPTYAMDLAYFINHIIKTKSRDYGLYHFSNQGEASWFDLAKASFDYKSIKINLIPIESDQYSTFVKRPFYSVLSKEKTKSVFDFKIRDWETALKDCLDQI